MTPFEITLVIGGAIVAYVIASSGGRRFGRYLAKRKHPASRATGAPDPANDAPLELPGEDLLGYAPFAEHIANGLRSLSAPRGFVVGIFGPWGSGKTTLLNFIEYFVTLRTGSDVDAKVVRFNPWWFSDREDLTRRFFQQIQNAVDGPALVDSVAADEIGDLAEALTKAGAPSWLRLAAELGSPPTDDVPGLKSRIASRLAERPSRIIVFIDDIDRLSKAEIREVFMLVKGVGDFPNVLYVLALDRTVVTSALSDVQGVSGDDYLGKIIQTSFDLPVPDPVALRDMFFEKLTALITETPDELFDRNQWAEVFWDGIDPLLKTPRAVIRLTNAVRATYPSLAAEVNGVDFVALETIRLYANGVYHLIRSNPERFLGDLDDLFDDRREQAGEFHQAWLSRLPEHLRAPIRALVLHLFPEVRRSFGQSTHYGGLQDTWKRQRRICHPDVFPIFFQLSVPKGSRSRVEMQALLSILNNQEAFSATLLVAAERVRRDGTTEARELLEELLSYEEDVPNEAVQPIVRAFFDIGDSLLKEEDEGREFIGFGNDLRMGRLTWALLRRFPEPERFEFLKDAMTRGRAVALAVHEATTLGQQHGKYDAEPRLPEEQLLTLDHVEQIEAVALRKIERAAEDGSLLRTPDLGSILYRWKRWGGDQPVRDWVRTVAEEDEGFLLILRAFVGKVRSFGAGDRVARIERKLDPKSLEPFMDIDEAALRAERIAQSKSLGSDDRVAVDALMRGVRARDSDDPDFP